MKLTTARLCLRDLEERDFEALRACDGDPEVQWWRGAITIPPDDTRRFLTQLAAERKSPQPPRYAFGITVPPDDTVVGSCWLILTYPDWIGAEIGYQLNRLVWGKGYATETVRAVLAFGFGELRLHRIWARVNPGNEASCRVLEKAGLTREGCLRRSEWAAGEWRDTLIYAILDDEFPSSG